MSEMDIKAKLRPNHIKKPDNHIPPVKTYKSANKQSAVTIQHPAKIELYSNTESLLSTALNTIGAELNKLCVKAAATTETLPEKEAKALTEMTKLLMAYKRQEVEMAKTNEITKKLSDMTDEELLKLATETLKSENVTKETET